LLGSTFFFRNGDGQLLKELVAGGTPIEEARASVFERDLRAIRDCDIVIAVLDGRTIDEGVAFELGYGRALGKLCIGLKTDDRVMLPTGDNPMIVLGCDQICVDLSHLAEAVRSVLNARAFSRAGE